MTQGPWDAEVLSRIAHLHLRARRAVHGYRMGSHKSVHTTSNIEFVDYQEYTPGDSLRHVDWKVAARSDRLVIRRHEAETEVPVTVVLDASGDLGTGGVQRPDLDGSKLGAAITMAATLSVFVQHHGDPLGLEILGGDDVAWRSITPRTGSDHLARIMGTLASVRPDGTADLASAFTRLGERLSRRSVVVLFSDLMEEPDTWGPQVAALVRRGIDLRVVHLYDPAEWNLDLPDSTLLYSPEGGDDTPVDPGMARAAFRQVVDEYVAEVRHWFGHRQGVHRLVPCDAPLEQVLGAVLEGRS